MTFYKLTDIITDDVIYVNPNKINFYKYTDEVVIINGDLFSIEVSKDDFEFMFNVEGIDEY